MAQIVVTVSVSIEEAGAVSMTRTARRSSGNPLYHAKEADEAVMNANAEIQRDLRAIHGDIRERDN